MDIGEVNLITCFTGVPSGAPVKVVFCFCFFGFDVWKQEDTSDDSLASLPGLECC